MIKQMTQFETHSVFILNQISFLSLLPLIAITTSILAVIIVIIAFYLVSTRTEALANRTSKMNVELANTPIEQWLSFSSQDFDVFLKKFLLADEIAVLRAMADFLLDKGIDFSNEYSTQEKIGWMNKHSIIQESNVSQKRVYSKNGIIDRMESLEIVEKKASDSSWGGMKYLYRLRTDSDFIQAYVQALQKKAQKNPNDKIN
ncbi:MAG: hypothetical protein JW779_01970 [Candidatus Thorarchaeota archaeon]|nr:hypothetical protein [Candidatus Thorarchaeota archaeon]